MREQEMASVHFLETRSRVSEDRYALGDLKQCMMLSQRHPSRSRVIQKEASVNFRFRIPALATLCVPSLPRPLLTFVNLRQHSAILKKTALIFGIFPRERFFPFQFTDADIWVMMNPNTYLPFSHFSSNASLATLPILSQNLPLCQLSSLKDLPMN